MQPVILPVYFFVRFVRLRYAKSTSCVKLHSPPAALMEAGSVVPVVPRPGRDGEPHVPVHQPGGRARGAGGRDSPAVRRAALPADAQAGDAQLRPGRPPPGLQNRRAHRQG